MIAHSTSDLLDQIIMQQQVLAAEQHDISPVFKDVAMNDFFHHLERIWCEHPQPEDAESFFTLPTKTLVSTDPTLLSRVIGNFIKNACEATQEGGEVSIQLDEPTNDHEHSTITIAVANNEVIPAEIRDHIFHQGHSTKGTGRGTGTYSARILTERYLHGQVSFTTANASGTVFKATIR